jgi:hypothetical protein
MTRWEYLLQKEASDPRLVMSRKETGALLGWKRSKIDKLIKSKALGSCLNDGRRWVHADSVYSYMRIGVEEKYS